MDPINNRKRGSCIQKSRDRVRSRVLPPNSVPRLNRFIRVGDDDLDTGTRVELVKGVPRDREGSHIQATKYTGSVIQTCFTKKGRRTPNLCKPALKASAYSLKKPCKTTSSWITT